MIISEKTGISIGLLIALGGGAGWLTRLNFQTDANAKALAEMQTSKEKDSEILTDIRERLSRIEGMLKRGK